MRPLTSAREERQGSLAQVADPDEGTCNTTLSGVDLNRNYGYKWGAGTESVYQSECIDYYHGTEPFSEPETRAIRDFLTKRQYEIKFVYNFHCAGAQFILPFNAEDINIASQLIPKQYQFFQEFINEASLPQYFKIGSASELLSFHTGGDAADWINYELGIAACEVELGNTKQIKNFEHDANTALSILRENESWL